MDRNRLRMAFNMVIKGNVLKARSKNVRSGQIRSAVLKVIGTGSPMSSPSLTLTICRGKRNKQLYLFNLNNGLSWTGGVLGENLCGIFFTRLSWQNQGHAAPTLFRFKSIQIPSNNSEHIVQLHGPSRCAKFMEDIYSFIFSHKQMTKFIQSTKICDAEDSGYSDENLTVEKIHLEPVISREQSSPNTNTSQTNQTVSYICKIADDFLSTIDMKKLETDFGITTSSREDLSEQLQFKQFRKNLKEGKPVLHPDTGEMINPCDVHKQRRPPTFIVVDCPSFDHFKVLEKSEKMAEQYEENSSESSPWLIIHMTPAQLISSELYQEWMKKFGTSCYHLIMNEDNKLCYSMDQCEHQFTLNLVCKELFPPINKSLINFSKPWEGNVIPAAYGLRCTMNDLTNFCDTVNVCKKEDLQRTLQQAKENITSQAEIIGQALSDVTFNTNKLSENYYPRISVLGCGASNRQKYRGQPGFLILLDEKSSILLDCGESTLNKLHQQFGEDAENVLSTIKAVFLSHCHFDHHSGFIMFMEQLVRIKNLRKKTFEDISKVYCLMPTNMVLFYDQYFKLNHPSIHDMVVLCSLEKIRHGHIQELDTVSAVKSITGLNHLNPIPVTHGRLTYGISLITQCHKKIVYSSDTLPMSRRLVYEGKDADLLIHDCLYVDDEWERDATIRKHSFLKGALATSTAMRAKFTLLTHFAPFLPVVPIFDLPEVYADKVACAYDYLNVSLSELKNLPKLESALMAVYKDSMEDYIERRESMKIRQEYRNETVQKLMKIL